MVNGIIVRYTFKSVSYALDLIFVVKCPPPPLRPFCLFMAVPREERAVNYTHKKGICRKLMEKIKTFTCAKILPSVSILVSDDEVTLHWFILT